MPHLDDGHIAELIDSAGVASGPDPAVAAHLRECAACRERVEEARALAAEARRILARAVPSGQGASAVPPFDEVLVRAGRAADPRARAVPWRGLAWAATVVMAVGVGWYARGELLERPTLLRDAPVAAAPNASLEQTGDDRAPSSLDTLPAAAAQASVAATPSPARALASEPTAPADRDEAATAVGGRGAVAPADSVAAAARQERPVAPAESPRPPAAAPPEARARRQAENELVEGRAVGLVAPQAAKAGAADRLTVASTWRTVTTADAARLLGRAPLVVDQLPIRDVSVVPEPDSVVRVRQMLNDSTVLELLQWREPPRSNLAREAGREDRAVGMAARLAPPAGNEVVVTADGLTVVARAALSVDSLRVLLARLR